MQYLVIQANQAAQTAALLRDMIETRHSSSAKDTRSRSVASGDKGGPPEATQGAKVISTITALP